MNWSLMLNALLLIGVVIAIVRTVQARRQQEVQRNIQQPAAVPPPTNTYDDIIAVRKVDHNINAMMPTMKPSIVVPVRQPAASGSKAFAPGANGSKPVIPVPEVPQKVESVSPPSTPPLHASGYTRIYYDFFVG